MSKRVSFIGNYAVVIVHLEPEEEQDEEQIADSASELIYSSDGIDVTGFRYEVEDAD